MKIKTRRYYIYNLAVVGLFFIAILPLKLGLFFAEIVGRLAFALIAKQRKRTIENLTVAFPEKPPEEIRRIGKMVFVNLCKNGVEWMGMYKLNKYNISKWVQEEGFENVDRALSKGNGLIVICSHFGNWELISFCFSFRGYHSNAIARRVYFKAYDTFINRMRRSKSVNVIYRDESPKKILKLLRRNEVLGIVADQDIDSVNSVFVNFFGRQAYTPKAPVALSLANGTPIMLCFVIREKNNRHRLILEGPIEIEEKADKEETIRFNTQKWSRILESYIRKYPEQWVWMHRRWKTQLEKH